MRKALIYTTLTLLLAGGGIAGWLYYTGAPPFATEEALDPELGEAVEGEEAQAEAPPIYLPLEPPFTVNFQVEGSLRFLQIAIVVMARDDAVIGAVEQHMPFIRNNLLMLLGNQTYDTLSTLEAKEKLRRDVLAEVRSVLDEVTGDPGIEAVYFTAFVMQ